MTNEEWEEDGEVTQMFSSRHTSEEEVLWNVCFTPKDQRPMTTDQVVAALSRREISAYTLVWREGMQSWVQIGNVPILVQARRSNSHAFSIRPNRLIPTPAPPSVAPASKVSGSRDAASASLRSSGNAQALQQEETSNRARTVPKPRPSLAQAAPPKPATVAMLDETTWADDEEEEPTRQMHVSDSTPTKPKVPKQRTLMGLGDSSPPESHSHPPASRSSIPPASRSSIPPPPRAVRVGGSTAATSSAVPSRYSVDTGSTAPHAPQAVLSSDVPVSATEVKQQEAASLTEVDNERALLLRRLRSWKIAAIVLAGVSLALLATTLVLLRASSKSGSHRQSDAASSK